MRGFDVAFAELRRESLQQPDLLLAELDLALGRGLLQAKQPLVLGQQPVALPHPAYAPEETSMPSSRNVGFPVK